MEDRYEIHEKIGQGGLGAVYRSYDARMNREVAIKRISVPAGDPELQAESTRQLIKEASALASLQHPNIVTIYDVGTDEDGPYVVMELISGKNLDELIERATFTWADFRELALQTQEALIAAQELDLIHSDIKPPNVMLTWLPSGKFQVKIVDFGLATLAQSQSLEELAKSEAIFGSIFFMAPEQFERVPLDARTDMYAMGCVYYQALTGTYPFKGETGHEVMVSHLHHTVTPIQDVRAGIPLWACDWIMWHINRQPADRPESARQALQIFLQNEKNLNPALSLGKPAPASPAVPRPRLVPQAIVPPSATPTLHPRLANQGHARPGVVTPEALRKSEPPSTSTTPQPLLPPEGSKPSIHTDVHQIPEAAAAPLATATTSAQPVAAVSYVPLVKKKKKPKVPKAAIAALLAVIGIVLAIFILNRITQSGGANRQNQILVQAAKPGTTEIPMSGAELAQLLEAAASATTENRRQPIYRALVLAKSIDSTNFDSSLAQFTATATLMPETRLNLINEVLAKRLSPAMVPPLTDFARTTNDHRAAVAALTIIRTTAGDEHFEPLLSVTRFHSNAAVKKAAEETATEILRRSRKRADLLDQVKTAIDASPQESRQPLLRIRAAGGGA